MAITDRTDIMTKLAAGKGVFGYTLSAGGITASTGVAASGHFTGQLRANGIGSTMPSTLVSWPQPSSSLPDHVMLMATGALNSNSSTGNFIGFLYKLGTLNLAATGDQFTHDAATFPVTRTAMGATAAIPLIPLVQITTATATTAPVFRLRTAGGAAGYVDQANNSVVGVKTMTMPAAATAAGSTFVFRLEEEDSSVLDITNIEVTTAGTAGAATIWGLEILSSVHVPNLYETYASDLLFGSLRHADLTPGTATSGTATTILGAISLASTSANLTGFYWGVNNA